MDRQRLLIGVAAALAVLWGADRLLLSGADQKSADESGLVLARLIATLQQPEDRTGEDGASDVDQAVDTILARPLFRLNRRPPEVAAPRVQERQEAPRRRPVSDDYALLATVIRSRGEPVAILTKNVGGETARLREGERLSGWEVQEITPDSVQFVADGEVTSLYLSTGGADGSQGGASRGGPPRGQAVQPSQRLNVSVMPPGAVRPGTSNN